MTLPLNKEAIAFRLDVLTRSWSTDQNADDIASLTEWVEANLRDDTSEDDCAEHGYDECPDCGNAGTTIDATGYVECTRFRGCWSDNA